MSVISTTYTHGGTVISLSALLRDSEGRMRYGYTILQDGEPVSEGEDLRSGVGFGIDFDDMLRALLSFADAYSESVQPGGWSADYGVFDGRVLGDAELALAEWFYAVGDDLPLEWRFDPDDFEG